MKALPEVENTENKRIHELDGIRGIAALLVIVWHYVNMQLADNHTMVAQYVKASTSFFWTGVDLFFVLSGFLLGGILLKNKTSKNYFRTFYIRRACRIFPIYYVVLIAAILICYAGIGYSTDWWFNEKIPGWTYFLYLQNIFMAVKESFGNRWLLHTWSLGLEEQFYLILPLLIYFLNRKALVIVLSVCVISAPVLRHLSYNWYHTFSLIFYRFDSLFSGVLLAVAMRNEAFVNFIKKYNKEITLLLFIMLFVTVLFSFRKLHLHYFSANTWFALLYNILLVLVLTNEKNIFSVISRNNILVKTGIISYGMYLIHQIVAGLMHFLIKGQAPQIMNLPDIGLTLLSFIITVILAHFSFKYFERKGIELGHRYKY